MCKHDWDVLVNSHQTSERDMREGCLRVGRRFVRVITIRYIDVFCGNIRITNYIILYVYV